MEASKRQSRRRLSIRSTENSFVIDEAPMPPSHPPVDEFQDPSQLLSHKARFVPPPPPPEEIDYPSDSESKTVIASVAATSSTAAGVNGKTGSAAIQPPPPPGPPPPLPPPPSSDAILAERRISAPIAPRPIPSPPLPPPPPTLPGDANMNRMSRTELDVPPVPNEQRFVSPPPSSDVVPPLQNDDELLLPPSEVDLPPPPPSDEDLLLPPNEMEVPPPPSDDELLLPPSAVDLPPPPPPSDEDLLLSANEMEAPPPPPPNDNDVLLPPREIDAAPPPGEDEISPSANTESLPPPVVQAAMTDMKDENSSMDFRSVDTLEGAKVKHSFDAHQYNINHPTNKVKQTHMEVPATPPPLILNENHTIPSKAIQAPQEPDKKFTSSTPSPKVNQAKTAPHTPKFAGNKPKTFFPMRNPNDAENPSRTSVANEVDQNLTEKPPPTPPPRPRSIRSLISNTKAKPTKDKNVPPTPPSRPTPEKLKEVFVGVAKTADNEQPGNFLEQIRARRKSRLKMSGAPPPPVQDAEQLVDQCLSPKASSPSVQENIKTSNVHQKHNSKAEKSNSTKEHQKKQKSNTEQQHVGTTETIRMPTLKDNPERRTSFVEKLTRRRILMRADSVIDNESTEFVDDDEEGSNMTISQFAAKEKAERELREHKESKLEVIEEASDTDESSFQSNGNDAADQELSQKVPSNIELGISNLNQSDTAGNSRISDEPVVVVAQSLEQKFENAEPKTGQSEQVKLFQSKPPPPDHPPPVTLHETPQKQIDQTFDNVDKENKEQHITNNISSCKDQPNTASQPTSFSKELELFKLKSKQRNVADVTKQSPAEASARQVLTALEAGKTHRQIGLNRTEIEVDHDLKFAKPPCFPPPVLSSASTTLIPDQDLPSALQTSKDVDLSGDTTTTGSFVSDKSEFRVDHLSSSVDSILTRRNRRRHYGNDSSVGRSSVQQHTGTSSSFLVKRPISKEQMKTYNNSTTTKEHLLDEHQQADQQINVQYMSVFGDAGTVSRYRDIHLQFTTALSPLLDGYDFEIRLTGEIIPGTCFVQYVPSEQSLVWHQNMTTSTLQPKSGKFLIENIESLGVAQGNQGDHHFGGSHGLCAEFIQNNKYVSEQIQLLELYCSNSHVVDEWLSGLVLLGNISKLSNGIDPL